MKYELEIVKFAVNDIVTASATCTLPAVPAPVGNAPEQACPGGA